jgi:hypothetical protein
MCSDDAEAIAGTVRSGTGPGSHGRRSATSGGKARVEGKNMRALRLIPAMALLAAGLLTPAPARAADLPITWLSCAHGTLANYFTAAGTTSGYTTLGVTAQAQPCTTETPSGQFGIALYKRERLTGQPAPAELVELSLVGNGGQRSAWGGYSSRLYGAAGVCVVAGVDVRLACIWIDDPQPGTPVMSDIAVDDAAVARPIEENRVVLIGRHSVPLCGTCW